ncbi:MAG: hypothetical protein US83_C0004G0115 [Candidatus Falkowbacteria bacterium GW2011_GWC2_38_22]|uniref:Uncharacterized protein n=1 Tax=Candidatus Falkowbacteria bacterium GW2011_GWE1_38_31 TaxID=1618638 RepID=A0A0G0JV71_9BACT|nr:MAG: hypothetical protein US73_C0002G0002 [Candidatus Falkowbacteria bacterium GW2011_GWF2_38_1205]KKQ61731.1 MAG: hypothetical protein US83_C0004G0115 [Candidatus Falkowbacteria bacterium GW2011_GWC2_38_22]KKQ63654.1 MAG: hypothetical protein US84_C0004G0002 [Candidatus Falkowbacteria bacterium GW2011_GWF1_38_22]KKQ65930.1 MAG: hypothetical protein US87_C0004G0115 [Candidatus Falkowbacteria bacterium GW2011_GWE2_38_254]KKQ70517.1 MAG: hypothetical protein US91_C0004G0002 [Candidatus Falkowb
MLTNNFALYGMRIFAEIGRDILFFPLWWYTRGLFNVVNAQINFIKDRQKSLALLVWIKNIFKPMYGQYDWQGMLISIFMRLVQIVFRSIFLFFWMIIAVVVVLAWVVLPVFVLYEMFFQLL